MNVNQKIVIFNFLFLNHFGIILMVVAHGKYFYENNETNKIHPEDLQMIRKINKE